MKYSKQQLINIKNNLERYCKPLTEKDIFRYNHSESLEHNLEVSKQFCMLSKEHFCIAVRPTLLNNNIPDLMILSFDKPMIKEILNTETDEQFKSKDYMNIQKIRVRI